MSLCAKCNRKWLDGVGWGFFRPRGAKRDWRTKLHYLYYCDVLSSPGDFKPSPHTQREGRVTEKSGSAWQRSKLNPEGGGKKRCFPTGWASWGTVWTNWQRGTKRQSSLSSETMWQCNKSVVCEWRRPTQTKTQKAFIACLFSAWQFSRL